VNDEARRAAFREGLGRTLEATDLRGVGDKYEGKVRDSYVRKDGTRVIVVTDRISAFDRVLGTLPYKGQILNRLSAWWFEKTKDVVANHLVSVPDPNVSIVRECAPLAVEVVMRAYLTGVTDTSIWTHYARGERTYCGHRLPDGLRKNERLPAALLTPSTKAPKGQHDEPVSADEIVRRGAVSAADWERVARVAHAVFARGQALAAERGLILVDTKYELGKTPEGDIVLIDEVHTPDSSRYWFSSTYEERFSGGQDPESFDKEYVRRWLAAEGYRGEGPPPPLPDDVRVEASMRYAAAFDRITGETFVPDTRAPLARIAASIGGAA